MSFKAVFPLVDFSDEFTFDNCNTNEDFLKKIVSIYYSSTEIRVKEATLAVYMAYRDHYPQYLNGFKQEQIEALNSDINSASTKIIKLRRIALSALAKVA